MNLLDVEIITQRLKEVPISMKYKEEIFKEFTKTVTKYMYPKAPDNIEDTEGFINHSLKWLKEGTNLQLIILHKETEEFIWCVWLHNLGANKKEFGVRIKEAAYWNGYGKEAILGIKERADKNLDYEFLLYPVDRANISSRKIAEAMGWMIEREYEEKNASWDILNLTEYRIYPTK